MSNSLQTAIAELNEIAETDITETVGYRATVLLRNALETVGGFNHLIANEIAIQVKIKPLEDYTNEELILVVEPFAKIISKTAWGFAANGFSISDYCRIASELEIEF